MTRCTWTGERACTVWQVHSADAVVVTGQTPGRRWLARADGMVTDLPGVPLTMRFADCAPILFYDPVRRATGIAHAGWRGTVNGAAVSTLRAMQWPLAATRRTSRRRLVRASVRRATRSGRRSSRRWIAAFGADHGVIRRAEDGSAYLDLWAANRLALERAGVRQIEVAGLCTASHVDEFFSHRGENGKPGASAR